MSTPKPSKNKDEKLIDFIKSGGRKGVLSDFNKIVKRASSPSKGGKGGNQV